MSKNIKLNDTDYNGVSTVQLPTTDGGTATFKDTDEITTPSGSKTITENGSYDVTNFASAVVNVPTETTGDGANLELKGTYTVNTNGYFYNASTISKEAITASYDNGMLVLIVDDADEDWSDVTDNGVRRIIVFYTTDKHILSSFGYRAGTGKQMGGTAHPLTRESTGKGSPAVNASTDYGNQYALNLNLGQSVKKYEMELDRTTVENIMYYGS